MLEWLLVLGRLVALVRDDTLRGWSARGQAGAATSFCGRGEFTFALFGWHGRLALLKF